MIFLAKCYILKKGNLFLNPNNPDLFLRFFFSEKQLKFCSNGYFNLHLYWPSQPVLCFVVIQSLVCCQQTPPEFSTSTGGGTSHIILFLPSLCTSSIPFIISISGCLPQAYMRGNKGPVPGEGSSAILALLLSWFHGQERWSYLAPSLAKLRSEMYLFQFYHSLNLYIVLLSFKIRSILRKLPVFRIF